MLNVTVSQTPQGCTPLQTPIFSWLELVDYAKTLAVSLLIVVFRSYSTRTTPQADAVQRMKRSGPSPASPVPPLTSKDSVDVDLLFIKGFFEVDLPDAGPSPFDFKLWL